MFALTFQNTLTATPSADNRATTSGIEAAHPLAPRREDLDQRVIRRLCERDRNGIELLPLVDPAVPVELVDHRCEH